MKKLAYVMMCATIIGGMSMLPGCSKDDLTSPVVTLVGDATDVVTYKSAPEYTDPGATATDAEDGELTVTVSGSVNMSSAGSYTLTYTATDKAGNKGTATREVIVDAAPYVVGNYSTHDVQGTTTTDDNAVITASTTEYNKIIINRFACYDGGVVYAKLSGSGIEVPSQTVNCGNPAADRTFVSISGSSFTGTTLVINYSETTNGLTLNGTTTFTKM